MISLLAGLHPLAVGCGAALAARWSPDRGSLTWPMHTLASESLAMMPSVAGPKTLALIEKYRVLTRSLLKEALASGEAELAVIAYVGPLVFGKPEAIPM